MRLMQIAEEIIALLAADPHAAVKVRVPGQIAQVFPNHPTNQIVVAIEKIGNPFGCDIRLAAGLPTWTFSTTTGAISASVAVQSAGCSHCSNEATCGRARR